MLNSAKKMILQSDDFNSKVHYLNYKDCEKTPKILLAEDHPMIQKMSKMLLTQLGCEVSIQSNGEEALRHYKASPNYYDLILLDINMPKMTGIEVCLYIRKIISDCQIPIIAYSTFEESTSKASFQYGFNDFIKKPASIIQLGETLRYWLPHCKLLVPSPNIP